MAGQITACSDPDSVPGLPNTLVQVFYCTRTPAKMGTEAIGTEIQLALLPKPWLQYRDTLAQRKDAVWVRILAKKQIAHSD